VNRIRDGVVKGLTAAFTRVLYVDDAFNADWIQRLRRGKGPKDKEKVVKSQVKGHYRTLSSGKRVWVKPHEDRRTRRPKPAGPAEQVPVRSAPPVEASAPEESPATAKTSRKRSKQAAASKLVQTWTTDAAATTKFNRAANLAVVIRTIRQTAGDMLKEKIGTKERAIGAIIMLIDQYCMRPGNLESREAREHYGATTLERRHVRTHPDGSVTLQFLGKKGIEWNCHVPAGRLAETITRLASHCKSDKDLVFRYRRAGKWARVPESAVNDTLRRWGVTAKDFRTYHATRLAFEGLKKAVPRGSEAIAKKAARKAILRDVIEEVAKQLNHEPSVCRAKYICPEVYEQFLLTGKPAYSSRWAMKSIYSAVEDLVVDDREFRRWLLEEHRRRGGRIRKRPSVKRRAVEEDTPPVVKKSVRHVFSSLSAKQEEHFPFVGTGLRKSDDTRRKQWWEDAQVGDERWITIHPSDNPEEYRHVKVKLRPGGKWRIVAGGTYLEHQEIVPKHELSEEERAAYEERRRRREAARKEREKEMEKLRGLREQHTAEIARAAGISPELTREHKEAIERKADKLRLKGEAREKFVRVETAKAEEAHKKWVSQAVQQLVAQARAVSFAVEPEKELQAIRQAKEEEEAQRRRAVERMLEARLAAAEKQPEEAAPEPEAEPEAKPEKPTEEPIYTPTAAPVIENVEVAQKLAILARESEKRLREARKTLPTVDEDRVLGTEALEEFTISADIADSKQAERELLQEREDRLRQQLNSSLVDIADSTWREDAETGSGAYERFGKGKYDVARAQATGALDAITGISKHFLGSSFIDRPIVEALGIDGAAALAAGEIIRRRGKEDAARILAEIADYQQQAALEVAQTALARHKELMDAKKTLEQAAKEPLVDEHGNLIADKLIQAADATALYGELTADALRHVGTALGSLQASASLMRLLEAGTKGDKRLDTLRVSLRDREDAGLIDRALRLKGRYKLEEVEGGTWAMVISPKALGRYLKEAKHDEELDRRAQAIQDGTADVDLHELPTGWKRSFVDEDGNSRRFAWKEGQKRALDFALARSNEKGGGAVIDLEVGGGKTAFAVGYFGALKERGWIPEGRRALYVAPKDSLATQVQGDIAKFTEYTTDRVGGGGRSHEQEIAERYKGNGFISVVTAPTLAADIKALERMGIDPSAFFRDLGYDAMVLDEAHQLVAGASGGSQTGSKIRKLRTRYNIAMTGTLATSAISQPFDLVRWAVGNKVDSRAKVLRKYGEVGLGTEAWQDAVNTDVRSQIDRYTFHGTSKLDAKLISEDRRVTLSHQQRAALREAVLADKKRTQAALAAARRQGRSTLDQATRMKLKSEYERDVYEILHNRDWKANPRLLEIRDTIKRKMAENPGCKFIIIGDTAQSLAGVHAVARMLQDEGYGDQTVMMASRSLEDKPISQQQMTRAQARFTVDPNCRFAVLAEPQAIGRNLTAGDVVIHLDVPPNAASRKQRRGRAYRTGRTRDVEEIMFWTDQHPFDVARRLNLHRTAGMLEAASGR